MIKNKFIVQQQVPTYLLLCNMYINLHSTYTVYIVYTLNIVISLTLNGVESLI